MNNRSFIKFLYYILFIFTAIYVFVISVEYFLQLENLKYQKSFWQDTILTGRIVRKDIFPTKAEYILDTGKIRVLLLDDPQYDDFIELNLGDYVTLSAKTRSLSFKNTYDMYIFNAYNVNQKAYIKEIKSIIFDKSTKSKLVNRLINKIYFIREKLILSINNNISYPYNGIILRLSLGYKDTEIREILEYFQDAGVMHVLVVSGLHVGFIYFMIYFLLKFIIIFDRKVKIILSMIGVVFYMLLTGCSPPVTRATIIFLCFCISLLFNREHSQYHSLTFAGLILLFINKRNLFSPSFQLSFLACVGIVYFYPFIYEYIKDKISKLSQVGIYIVKLFIITVSAQIFTLPLILFYFNKFSLVSFFTNILVIPLTSVLLWLSIGYCLFMENSYFSFYIAKIIEFIAMGYVKIIEFFAKIPFSSIKVGLPKWEEIFLYYLFVILLPIMLKKKKYLNILYFFIVFVISIILLRSKESYKFKITFFNVGIGNATLIQTYDKKIFLIDSGGNYIYDVGRYKLYPYFLKNSIHKIDYLIISHPHFPHYLGLSYLSKKINIKNCIISNYIGSDVDYKQIIFNLGKRGCNISILHQDKQINFLNEGKIFLYPSYRPYDTDEILLCDANSILVGIKYKDFLAILSNDIPNQELNELIRKNFLNEKVSLFLVSREEHFKNDLKPKLTIVSNGFKNFKDKRVPLSFYLDDSDIEIIINNTKKIEKIIIDKDKTKIFF